MVLNTTPVSIGIPDPQDAAETAGLTTPAPGWT